MTKLNNRGAISIIFVIGIFIASIIIMGFINITNKTIAINEVQGIMDVSGVIALRSSVDETDWKLEKLTVDKSNARATFIDLVNKSVGDYVGKNGLLSGYRVEDVRIYEHSETKISGQQGKREYFLEAVGVATYSTYSVVDKITFDAVNYFDFLSTGGYSSVATGGEIEDGKVEVIIRTVSRLVLR